MREAHTRRSEAVANGTIAPWCREQYGFDWIMVILSAWLVGGLFIDGWAHTHGRVDTTFFTPWHAAFYTGFLAVAGALVGALVYQVARRRRWRQALPLGYNLSLLGTVIFGCGGVGDLLWHTLFGIEQGVEALFSPTHIMLACGMWLIVGGPFRAAWERCAPLEPHWQQWMPLFLSLTWMLSVCTFFTQMAHPMVYLWGGGSAPSVPGWGGLWQAFGVVGMLWDSGLLIGFLLLTIRRWAPPAGVLALVVGLNAVAMGLLYHRAYPFVPVVARAIAGLGADGVYAWLQPSVQRPRAWRLFAFIVPTLFTTLHFVALGLTVGVWWSVHLWAGTIVLTGLVGLLLSMLLVPPPVPDMPQEGA